MVDWNVDAPSCSNDDQIVPVALERRAKTRKRPLNVKQCIEVIHKSFLTTFKYSTNDNFRKQMLLNLKAQDPTQISQKLSEHLWSLTESVYGINERCESDNAKRVVRESEQLPSKTHILDSSTSIELQNVEMAVNDPEINESLFFDDNSSTKCTSNVHKQTVTTLVQQDTDWFEELLFEESDSD